MTVSRKDTLTLSPWLLLVFSLPRKKGSLRVSVWRKLQRYGSLPLGNSGYLLPNDTANREKFEWLATTIRSARGDSSVVEVQSIDNYSTPQLKKRFLEARSDDYRALLTETEGARTSKLSALQIARLRQRFQDISGIDFFCNPMRKQVERALAALNPSDRSVASIGKISPAAYRDRVWITRPRPGVDRVMSAWLIRKYIDRRARFAFDGELKTPRDAVAFDMYDGGFGHRGEDCTFETLTKAFRIRDKAVQIMGQIVHDADLFDDKFGRKEGFGIDQVMKGLATQNSRDSELLDHGMELAEALYQSLRNAK
jgi:hypothetical protein